MISFQYALKRKRNGSDADLKLDTGNIKILKLVKNNKYGKIYMKLINIKLLG